MTQEALGQLMEGIFEELRETRKAGQAEYAHKGRDAFANFDRLAADLQIPREAVLWVYAMKHRDGIAAWINGHRSQREDVRGRIKDLMVYLCLLWGMVEEEEQIVRAAAMLADEDLPF
jgi:hypothetical protein